LDLAIREASALKEVEALRSQVAAAVQEKVEVAAALKVEALKEVEALKSQVAARQQVGNSAGHKNMTSVLFRKGSDFYDWPNSLLLVVETVLFIN
jgi:hypothetical protein